MCRNVFTGLKQGHIKDYNKPITRGVFFIFY
jgi:hypothetical protein